MPELTVEKDIFTISTWFNLLTSKDQTVKKLAWKEIADYARLGNVSMMKDAEYNINSGNCQHFLNWCTRSDGTAPLRNRAGGDRRVSSLLRALGRLGCAIKKDEKNHLQLFVGTVQVKENITQTLRGVHRTQRAAKWMNDATGIHINLSQKAREGNWWISKPDYISEEDYKFACKVRVNCLPCPANKLKWRETDSKACPLCGHPNCNQAHILSGCPKLMNEYAKRHDKMVNAVENILLKTVT